MENDIRKIKELNERKKKLLEEIWALEAVGNELADKIETAATKRMYISLSLPSELLENEFRFNTLRVDWAHTFCLEIVFGDITIGIYDRLISKPNKDGVIIVNESNNNNWVNLYTESKKSSEIIVYEETKKYELIHYDAEWGNYNTETILIDKINSFEYNLSSYLCEVKLNTIEKLRERLNITPIFNNQCNLLIIKDDPKKITTDYSQATLSFEENCIENLCQKFSDFVDIVINDLINRDFVLFEDMSSSEEISRLNFYLDLQKSEHLSFKLNRDLASQSDTLRKSKI